MSDPYWEVVHKLDAEWDEFKKTGKQTEPKVKPVLSLGEYLIKVISEVGIESDEFKGLVRIYGKEYLREVYRKEKAATK